MSKKLKTLGLASALAISSVAANAAETNYELTGQEKINELIASIDAIQSRIQTNGVMTVGAVGYAAIGGVVEDGSLSEGLITSQELGNYLNAKDMVLNHDYAVAETAEQMFMQEHAAAMNSLSIAVDDLTAATSVVMTAVEVASIASEADTKPEQVELQGMLETDAYTLDAEEANTYNEAVVAVETFAQQAGAFMAAANNEDLTSTVDTYAAQGSFMVGTYTAISYTQSMDEFVIAWDDSGFGTGFQGYLTPEFKNADDIYGAGQYINEYGGYPTQ